MLEHAAEEKQAAQKWMQEQDEFRLIAQVLDRKPVTPIVAEKKTPGLKTAILVSVLIGFLVIWFCYIVFSAATPRVNQEPGKTIGGTPMPHPSRGSLSGELLNHECQARIRECCNACGEAAPHSWEFVPFVVEASLSKL